MAATALVPGWLEVVQPVSEEELASKPKLVTGLGCASKAFAFISKRANKTHVNSLGVVLYMISCIY